MKRKLVLVLAVIAASLMPLFAQNVPNIRGMEFVIGNWFEEYDTDTYKPENEADQKILEWRKKVESEYGFRVREKMVAGWGELLPLAAMSIRAGSPAAHVFVMQQDWAISFIQQGLAYPVSDSRVINFSRPQPAVRSMQPVPWNRNTHDMFTINRKIYAFSEDINMNNAYVIFYNKRLFREAGLDPDLPYNMQRDGTWTWDNFLNICKQLTGNGKHAMTTDMSTDIMHALISSNGAQYLNRNARNGRMSFAANSPEFMEAAQFFRRLNSEGVLKHKPEGTPWDWYKAEFLNGNVAMRIDESYVWNELGNMKDDWGVVLPPRGPRARNYIVNTRENVMVIPASFTPAEVDQILWALSLWYTPVTDDWKSRWYATFRDRRAVDETLELIRNTNLHVFRNHILIPAIQTGDIAWSILWHENPQELINEARQKWNEPIENFNRLITTTPPRFTPFRHVTTERKEPYSVNIASLGNIPENQGRIGPNGGWINREPLAWSWADFPVYLPRFPDSINWLKPGQYGDYDRVRIRVRYYNRQMREIPPGNENAMVTLIYDFAGDWRGPADGPGPNTPLKAFNLTNGQNENRGLFDISSSRGTINLLERAPSIALFQSAQNRDVAFIEVMEITFFRSGE